MTTRADLADAVQQILVNVVYQGLGISEATDAVLDVVLPQVTTAEQLEALPSRSMLVDCDGEPAVKVKRLTVIDDAGMGNAWTVEEFAEDCLPATVVWQPQPEQETRADA